MTKNMTKIQEQAIRLAQEESENYEKKLLESWTKHRDAAFDQISKELPVEKIEDDPHHLLLEGTKYRIDKIVETDSVEYYLSPTSFGRFSFNNMLSYGQFLLSFKGSEKEIDKKRSIVSRLINSISRIIN